MNRSFYACICCNKHVVDEGNAAVYVLIKDAEGVVRLGYYTKDAVGGGRNQWTDGRMDREHTWKMENRKWKMVFSAPGKKTITKTSEESDLVSHSGSTSGESMSTKWKMENRKWKMEFSAGKKTITRTSEESDLVWHSDSTSWESMSTASRFLDGQSALPHRLVPPDVEAPHSRAGTTQHNGIVMDTELEPEADFERARLPADTQPGTSHVSHLHRAVPRTPVCGRGVCLTAEGAACAGQRKQEAEPEPEMTTLIGP